MLLIPASDPPLRPENDELDAVETPLPMSRRLSARGTARLASTY